VNGVQKYNQHLLLW